MNKLNVLILATAAVLAAAWFANHRADQQFGLESGDVLLPGFAEQLAQIDTVIITAAGNDTSTLKNVDGQWQVQERAGYVADIDAVSKALRLLAKATMLEAKTALASNYAQLGVQDVDLAKDTTTRLQALADDAVLADVLIGKSGRGGHYVRLADHPQSWLIDQRINLPRNTPDYLDRDVLKLPRDEVAKVEVTPLQGSAYAIRKTNDQAATFELLPAASGDKQTNTANVNRLAAALANLSISDVLSQQPEGLQWSQAKVTSTTGLLLTLDLAQDQDAGERYLKLAAQLDPEFEQSLHAQMNSDNNDDQPAEPSTEDSVAQRVGAAKQRAATLNTLAQNRVFIAPQYTVDALMMTHEMLQKEPPAAQ